MSKLQKKGNYHLKIKKMDNMPYYTWFLLALESEVSSPQILNAASLIGNVDCESRLHICINPDQQAVVVGK